MDGSVMPFLIVVASLAAFQWWIYRLGGRRMQSPLWYAFNTTAAAALFLISGSLGYTLQKGLPLFAAARWSDASSSRKDTFNRIAVNVRALADVLAVAGRIIDRDDQAVLVSADVEDDSVPTDDARVCVNAPYVCRRTPVRPTHIVVPRP